ncbi:MAG: hypothetical protein AAF909_10510 [Pseudomonadota bacterium]
MSERFEDALSERKGGYRAGLTTALGHPADARPARLAGPTSELGAPGAVAADVIIEEAPLMGVVVIRAALDEPAVWADLRAAIGVEGSGLGDEAAPPPPRAAAQDHAGSVLAAAQGVLLRPEPGEAVLLTPYDQAPAIAAALSALFDRRGLEDGSADLAQAVSDGWGGVVLHGSAAREVAAQVADIDAHPAALPAGAMQKGRVGAALALLYAPEHAGERLECWVRRSETPGISALLCAAAAAAPPEAIPSASDWESRRRAP